MNNKAILMVVLGILAISVVTAHSDSFYVDDYGLQAEYDSAVSGDVFSLTVELSNDANTEKTFKLEFDEDDPFEFMSDEDWEVTVDSGETVKRTFRIEVDEDTESKTYDLDFNLDDGDDDWDDGFEIKVTGDRAELSLGEIVSSPKKILPGSEDVALEVTLVNNGDIDAEDLTAELILPQGFEAASSYSNKVYAGDVKAGETENLIFYFDVDESLLQQTFQTKIKLTYEADGDDETTELQIELPVFPIPQFEIIKIENIDSEITKGSDAKIKVSIRNMGGEKAEDLSLKVYERSDQPFSFEEKSAYVGSLEVGQTGYAIFEFEVERDAEPSIYMLDFQTRCIDGDSVIVDDLTSSIRVTEKETNLASYWIYIISASAVLLIGIFLLIVRRSKNGN